MAKRLALTSTPPDRRRAILTVIIFAVVFVGLQLGAYTQKSATWDEPVHVSDGYASLVQHDYRIDPEHPPFLRMWAALPLLAMPATPFALGDVDRLGPAAWAWQLYPYCRKFLYTDNDADRLLYRARFMIVLLGVGLGVLVFAWAYEWLGYWPAVVTLAGYTLEPNLAAHASLVTTDFGFTAFMFGTIYCLWRSARAPSFANMAGATAFFVLAVISKFSAILLAPIVVVLLVWAVWRRMSLNAARATGLIATFAVAAWVGVWAVYGFRYAPTGVAGWLYDFQKDPMVVQHASGLSRAITWIDEHHLLPNVFSQGFLLGQAKAQVRPAFLAGDYSTTGWPSYFPIAVLIKTPLAILLLAAAGAIAGLMRRARTDLDAYVFVVAPVAVFMGAAMTTHINIGVRHVLPIYPFLILLIGLAARELLSWSRQRGAIVLSASLAFGALECFGNYPDHLAFFNLAVGGPSRGGEYLTDSNLDWGQDLKPLKKWMDDHRVARINLAYFGSAAPAYYGIEATYLPGSDLFQNTANIELPGYVAISATILNGVYLPEPMRAFYRPFRQMAPVASVGKSILVYRVDRPWWQ